MLNQTLFEALRAVSPEVSIIHEGESGAYEVHAAAGVSLSAKRTTGRTAFVTRWGETYKLNCPICGDTRQRLFICHLLGVTIGKGAGKLRFSRSIAMCHNQHCNIYPWLMQLPGINWQELTLVEGVSPTKSKGAGLSEEIEMPRPSIPLMSDEVPQRVHDYLIGRGFDPQQLYTQYRLHYAPQGALWNIIENKALYEDRIVIPIFHGGILTGWQARDITGASPIKYLTAPGWRKTEALYNMDVAKWFRDIVIVEGPTDVWRAGENSIALMGKTLSAGSIQAEILQTLWGDRGRVLICLDSYEDDPSTLEAAAKLMETIHEIKAFPEGIAMLQLPSDDPGSWDEEELRSLLNQCFADMQRRV